MSSNAGPETSQNGLGLTAPSHLAQQAGQDSPPPHLNVTSGNTPGTPTTTRSVPLASRRAHVKSKRGCRTCKRRKVKCDEQHPSCGNCIKHAVTCDFVFEQREAASSPGLGQTPGVSQPLPTNTSDHQTHHVPPRLPNITQQHDGGDLNMIDLQLLHNFTTFTHLTLSSDPAFRQMLTTTAISMAFDCQFLMRTILALSALHLARFRHSKRDYYINIGLGHYQVASRLATRHMDHLDRLTREDCEHLHLFAVLTLFIALGMPKQDQNSLILGEAVVPNWLIMLRSAEPILRVLNPTTYRGRLSPLFSYGKQRWRVLFGDYSWKDGSLMVDLQGAINQSCTDPELLSIYNSVINRLRNVLSCLMPHTASGTGQERQGHQSGPSSPASAQQQITTPSLEAWDIFVWQWDSAKDFIPLLRGSAPQQEAMTIYAHFLVMLKKLENQWWLEGWATYLMERIWESLEDDYKSWVLWPIQELGWVPP